MEEITKGTRIINFIIDHLFILILFFIISVITYSTSDSLYLLFYLFYYISFEFFNDGQTVGKLITKTKVVNIKNKKPSFIRILWRTLLRLNPFDMASFLFGQEGHDSISRTKLITTK